MKIPFLPKQRLPEAKEPDNSPEMLAALVRLNEASQAKEKALTDQEIAEQTEDADLMQNATARYRSASDKHNAAFVALETAYAAHKSSKQE